MGRAAFWADESSSFFPTHDKDGIVQQCVCVCLCVCLHSDTDSPQIQPTVCTFLYVPLKAFSSVSTKYEITIKQSKHE